MSSADLTVLRYVKESVIGVTPDNSVRASGVLTVTANFANTETVTIGSRVYTFQTTLTNVSGNVKIAATAALTLVNLFNALNSKGGIPGTDYAISTLAHDYVDPTAFTATTLTVRAKVGGTSGNSLATTDTSATAAWAAATLAGGTNSSTTALTQIRYTGESLNFNIDNTKTSEITPTRVETDLIQTAASGGGDINIEMSYNSFDDFLASCLCSTWAANVLTNGTILDTYTIQKSFPDVTPPQFHNYRGTAVESLKLSMEVGKIVTGSFSFMSFGLDPDTGVTGTQFGGATFVSPPTTTPMNAVTNVQNFMIESVPYSGCISKLDFEIKNNIRAIKCIGSLGPKDMKLGTLEVTGSMEFYFNDGSNYARFVAGEEFDFSFMLVDDANNAYTLKFDRCKFESGEVVAGGRNSDVMFKAKWRALYNGTVGRVLQITRLP